MSEHVDIEAEFIRAARGQRRYGYLPTDSAIGRSVAQAFSDPLMDLMVHPDCPPQVTVTANRPHTDTRHAVLQLRCQPHEGRRDRFVASPAGYEHTNQKPAAPWWATWLSMALIGSHLGSVPPDDGDQHLGSDKLL